MTVNLNINTIVVIFCIQIAQIVLKLFLYTTISWLFVFTPLIGFLIIYALLFVFGVILGFIGSMQKNARR